MYRQLKKQGRPFPPTTCGSQRSGLRARCAKVLFHVVNVRHLKKRPTIFTINKPLHQGGRCYTTRMWRPPSWIASLSAGVSFTSTDLLDGHVICMLCMLMVTCLPLSNGSEFLELTAHNFRNSHTRTHNFVVWPQRGSRIPGSERSREINTSCRFDRPRLNWAGFAGGF